ncbi:MAG: hypothetical protein RL385_2177 [Pseudomonadota bacterium]
MTLYATRAWPLVLFLSAALPACTDDDNTANPTGSIPAVGFGTTDGGSPGTATTDAGAAGAVDASRPGTPTLTPPGNGGGTIAPGSGGGAVADGGAPNVTAPADGGATAPVPADGGATAPATGGGAGALPPATDVSMMGPWATTIEMNVGPNRGWVVHPTDLGKDGVLHPIFTWGAGAGTNASNYKDHLTLLASHGFVVEAHASTGDGSDHKGALDWLIEQNEKSGGPYYHKLNTKKVAAGGHSQGSVSTFAFAKDPRLVTTIHVAGGSFDGNGPNNLAHPAAYFCGADDTAATPNCKRDFMNTKVPVFLTVMDGVDHIYAARNALPMMVSWLRWHLNDETTRKDQFISPTCEFCTGKYKSESKNW